MIKANVNCEDAYSLGLLYVYIYSNTKQLMVKLDDLKIFNNCIKSNLEEMKSDVCSSGEWENESIYFSSNDENGKIYYILKPDLDLNKVKSIFIGCMPVDIIIASQMPNALEALGLVMIDNKIETKKNTIIAKNNDECCNTCDYAISDELLESIREENSKYKYLSDNELRNAVGWCEMNMDIKNVSSMDYYCPNYLSNKEFNLTLKKTK